MRLDRVEHPAVKDLLRLCTTVLPTARATAHGAADAQAVKRWFRLPAATCAAKMRRAFRFAMTTAPGSPSPAAVVAFLRGIDRRARLFATVQAGDPARGARALAVVARVFAAEAGQWPLAQWPQQYWRLLLATPSLRQAAAPDGQVVLAGIARLPADARAGVLLQLVAGLGDADAALALGLPLATYQARIRDSLPRDPLGQPDVDVWRAWRAAAQRELELGNAAVAQDAPAPPTTGPRRVRAATVPELPAPHGVRWLWLGVAGCVLAFAAAFFIHPAGREAIHQWFATIKSEPLPPAAAAKARFDAGDIALHPDRERLAAPREAWFADRLALLAWLANAEAGPAADPAAAEVLPLPGAAPAAPPSLPDAGRQATQLAQRMRAWDALPPRARGLQRGHWQAWQALEAGERVRLRSLGERLRMSPAPLQQALRERFDAQTSDARAGWWLGPRLGRDWPRVAALFGYVEAAERGPLMDFLRTAGAEDIDACARLAQTTPPEQRAALRAQLLAQPAAQRGGWLQARLQR